MLELRANTAVDVLIGPFVDDTDGKTAETALTISQADVKLSKNGQALTQKNDDTAAAHDAAGYYNCELDATDTNTEGTLVLVVSESGALPVRHEFAVLSEAAWDSKYLAKDDGFMDVNMKAISDDTTAADNLELQFDGSGLSGDAYPARQDQAAAILLDTGTDGVVVATASKTGYSLTATTGLGNQTANITGNLSGSVGSVTNGVTLADDAITASKFDETTAFPITGVALNGTNANTLSSHDPGATLVKVADLGVVQTGDSYAVVTNATYGLSAVHTDLASVAADVSSVLTDTGTDGVKISVGTGVGQINLSSGKVPATVLASDITGTFTESYASDNSAFTLAQALYMIWGMLGEANAAGTTLTVKKLDGSTTAMTFTLDSATAPTSITRAS